jgi:uncharacterized protein (DUF58 family)
VNRTAFPLIPRHRLSGVPFGTARSIRRGRGSDLAGFRAYVPGDPVSTIDWHASARLSTARGDDEFVVRERFADEAPRVVIVVDRSPTMRLYPDWSPWLAKPEAVGKATHAIVDSAIAARASAGYLDYSADGPFWIPPRGRDLLELIEEHEASTDIASGHGTLERAFTHLATVTAQLGAGSFVFVLSDFLDAPPHSVWLAAQARRWEIVPVVIQDPTWEQSFPSVGPVILPIVDPDTRSSIEVRLTRSEARAERGRREQARARLLAGFASLGLDPVILEDSDPDSVLRMFFEWADRRRRALWRRQ